jgi:hypothetical protein
MAISIGFHYGANGYARANMFLYDAIVLPERG